MRGSRKFVSAALFLWAAVILSLGGCAAYKQNNAAATASLMASPDNSGGASATSGPLQSTSEADMVQFYHFLLVMDEGPKTTISKKQAEAVLPVVRKNVQEGNMSESDKAAVLGVFRPEQKALYSRWTEGIKSGGGKAPKPGDHPEEWTDQERQQWKDEWMKQWDSAGQGHSSSGLEPAPSPGSPDHGSPGTDDWSSGEKNVEQLLMERLENKLKM